MVWRFLVLYTLLILGAIRPLHAERLEDSPRSLVHLLDYLAADYGGAVSAGKVLNNDEYSEQLEFVKMAFEIGRNLAKESSYRPTLEQLKDLKSLIASKADATKVTLLANQIKQSVIQTSKLALAPTTWPSLKNGKALFDGRCGSCHGVTGEGNGPASAGLDPKPRNFLDDSYMRTIAPFHSFNVVKLGIPGTSMVAVPNLSDREIWDLSFYVQSLRAQSQENVDVAMAPTLSLEQVASRSDAELEGQIQGNSESKKLLIAALRLKSNDDEDGTGSLQLARKTLLESAAAYERGDRNEARRLALSAYLDGVEPAEPQLRALNPHLTSQVERAMALVRSNIETSKSIDVFRGSLEAARGELTRAETQLRHRESSAWVIFSMAAGIVFREGFEAILIILAIMGVIRAASAKKAARYVHGGWLAAVVLGVLAWFFSGWVLVVSGAQRELSEGIASLFAVVVLLYMGFWLHSKTEIHRWKSFINGKVRNALDGSSRWGLFVLAFIAVFREALETVLFMRALTMEGSRSAEFAMFAGVATSFVSIFVLAWAFLKYSVRLPVRKLFSVSSIMMVVLSVILVGKGLRSLQETGLLQATFVSIPELPLMGVFPTLETILAQAGTLIACAVIWYFLGRAPTAVSREETQ